MFDDLVTATAGARTATTRLAAYTRVENAACARRLAAMADMLSDAYAASGSAERDQWIFDNWAAVAARIGAAHGVTTGVASGLLLDARALRERLPRVAALFAAGIIAYRFVHLICQRTPLVRDPAVLARLDAAIAALFADGTVMSMDRAQTDIDALVHQHDPYAVRRTIAVAHARRADVHIDDADGAAHITATVSVVDGTAVDHRLDALARTTCHRDPRDLNDRRAAAMGAMAFGWDRLPCMCEHPDCDAARKPAGGGVVIHLIAHPDTTENRGPTPEPPPPPPDDEPGPDDFEPPPDQHDEFEDADEFDDATAPSGETDSTPAEFAPTDTDTEEGAVDRSGQPPSAESDSPPNQPASAPMGDLTAQRRALAQPLPPITPRPWYTYTWTGLLDAVGEDPGQYCPARPGAILGGAVVPAPVVAEAAMHATIRTLIDTGQSPPEPRYRPSRALADWVRCRDRTCRFPGCTRPATRCQLDHVIPHPWGPTAAANLACLCTAHHLLKTFWPGWTLTLDPDGTAHWTTPDGDTLTTQPGSRLLFPELCAPTAPVTTTGTPPPKHTAGLTMPRRRTTRADARHYRVDYERQQNAEQVEHQRREDLPPF